MSSESFAKPQSPSASAPPSPGGRNALKLRDGIKGGSAKLPVSRPRLIVGIIVGILLLIAGLGIYWSQQPPKFDVLETTERRLGVDPATVEPGAVSVATAIEVASTLLEKPGGYLHNDVMPPGVYLTFMPNWEYGVLTELRDSVQAFRNDFGRAQTQSLEDANLKEADLQFKFDANSWMLPASEQEYRKGIVALERFLEELKSPGGSNARFYIRADNLGAYLQLVEKRLGGYGQRLVASVGDPVLMEALAAAENDQADAAPSWFEVERTFYEARGYSWALLHMMRALAIEFSDVLKQKNAEVSMQNVIRDLELATVKQWSPLVLNGHGFGMFANHSLVLASYVARTNSAVLDLRRLLERG